VLLSEVDELARRGLATEGRLFVSDRAHLILSYHLLVDGLREGSGRAGLGIGTTKRGIGPAYEDKAARRGIRVGALRDLAACEKLVEQAIRAWAPAIRDYGGEAPTVASVMEWLRPLAPRIVPMLADASRILDDAVKGRRGVLLEGAQGTLLDVDHGTYPFVTSSSAVAGGAATGAGIGPTRIDTVLGITKAYATRVGAGPFPTELSDATGQKLREDGAEFGSVTGRPRRTGWLDLPALRYAARVNGLDGLALTKLDVLTGHPELKVCVAYDTPSGRTEDLPIDELDRATPVYATLEGWTESLAAARVLDDLPRAARAYVRFLEEGAGVPLYLLSVGPRRSETIVLHNPFTGRAGAP
jgi:adenylosuccinate synthase